MDKLFKQELKSAKSDYYAKMVADLRRSKPHQWYSCLKRMMSHDEHKREELHVSDIGHLSDQVQCEIIADHFASVQNEFNPLQKGDIDIPSFSKSDIPQFTSSQVWLKLSKIKTNKSTVPGDLPAKVIKQSAVYLAEPLTDIINCSLIRGEYPNLYKFENITPVPKVHPCESVSQLRNISGLVTFDKVMEDLIAEILLSDMKHHMDPSQFGNKKGLSVQHYLIKMINRILTAVDKNTQKEAFAVVANLIDWKSAFPKQCHKLGIESFIKNGVRPELIPLLINYFQNRKMCVRFHGCQSKPRNLNGGGPQGATFGILEYLSQSNNNADCVDIENRYKFIDDLTVLEIINLMTIGLTSFNIKQSVPSDIATNNVYIPPENLESQAHLNNITEWTENQKMEINEKKSKVMIFNFTKKYQFTTRLQIKGKSLETIKSTKLLGTIIQDNLKWDENTEYLVKRANSRMNILRKAKKFNASKEDLTQIYTSFIRCILEQSCTVWHSSISSENKEDLERVQKNSLKIILGNEYKNYSNAQDKTNLVSLEQRREILLSRFANNCLKHEKTKNMFPLASKKHSMETREKEKFEVYPAKTERLKKSAIIKMQSMLNNEDLLSKIYRT